MKLYNSIGPNPKVVRMVIAEKGLTIDTVTIDLMGGENRQPAYSDRVPTGGTPALELDNGLMLAEITAIAEYLEDIAPSPPILGTSPEERAEARMWSRRIDLYILEPMTTGFRCTEGRPLFLPRMMLLSEGAGAELKAHARAKLLWLDALMAGRTWVCGDRFTLADCLLYAFMEFGATVGQPIPPEATWVTDWFARASERPSAKA
ncbi:glutathione S-transferase [alpha proteobacterium AAP81b]|nr:glutathione S-transferase [alpha proteobacterium AAP81b]